MSERKFTVIGAGGTFTCGLLVHLARERDRLFRELGETTLRLSLLDIDADRLARTVRLGEKLIAQADLTGRIVLEPLLDEDAAFDGTDLVQLIRPFHVEETRNVAIARQHGIVGGHDGPASIGLARFVLPVLTRVAEKIKARGNPGVRLINYTNPTDILAQAVTLRTGLEVWGWCGAPDGLREHTASLLGVTPEHVTRLRSVGVNHFGYITELEVDGKPALDRLRQWCADQAPTAEPTRFGPWAAWVRDTGWPYLTIGHPAPWNFSISLQDVWLNPEAPPMYAAIDHEITQPYIDTDLLVATLGWQGTTGLAMTHLLGAVWGSGTFEVGWQCRHDDAVPGLPAGAWLERTMRVEAGDVHEVDYRPLPETLEAQLRLLALQHREFGHALASDDHAHLLYAFAINPFTCPMLQARAYVEALWKVPLPVGR